MRTEGKSGHGGRPYLGVNAIYKIVGLLTRLSQLQRDLARKKHPLVSSPSMNVGTINGGTRINVVPDTCIASIDRRLIPGETIQEAVGEVLGILGELKAGDKDFKETHTVTSSADAFEISRDLPIVRALENAIGFVTGQPAPIGGKDAATDAIWLVKSGIPTALLGLDQYKTAHTADECVEIDKLVAGTKVMALAAYDVLGRSWA